MSVLLLVVCLKEKFDVRCCCYPCCCLKFVEEMEASRALFILLCLEEEVTCVKGWKRTRGSFRGRHLVSLLHEERGYALSSEKILNRIKARKYKCCVVFQKRRPPLSDNT